MFYIKKNLLKIVFIVYLIGLLIFVVIKFNGSIADMVSRVQTILWNRSLGYWNVNFIPFRTILHSDIKLNIENVVAFVPMGLLLGLRLLKPSFIKALRISFIIIIAIEAIQFVACIGIADIDDVILNLVGCSFGYMVYVLLRTRMMQPSTLCPDGSIQANRNVISHVSKYFVRR